MVLGQLPPNPKPKPNPNPNPNPEAIFFGGNCPDTTFFIKSLKSKKKKMALTSFYYVSREIWLVNSKKLTSIDQSRFYIFSHPREFKNV